MYLSCNVEANSCQNLCVNYGSTSGSFGASVTEFVTNRDPDTYLVALVTIDWNRLITSCFWFPLPFATGGGQRNHLFKNLTFCTITAKDQRDRST
jgi:hypothetical protein